MIRVPTPLIEAVRELSRLHRQGRTKAVLEGVEKLVIVIDSETDIDIDSVRASIAKLTERLERLESEQSDSRQDIDIGNITLLISDRLEKVETDIELLALTITDLNVRLSDVGEPGDIANDSGVIAKPESSPLPVAPLNQSTLAKRLGCSDKAIEKHRKQGSKENFAAWSRERDPNGITWTWEGQGGRGQPLQFMPDTKA